MRIIAAICILLLAGCATNHAPDNVDALRCPFGSVEWSDRDGRRCVPKYQMERALGW